MVTPSGFFGDSTDKIFKVENLVRPEEIEYILHTAKTMDIWNDDLNDDSWRSRISEITKLNNASPETYQIIKNIQSRFMFEIENFYQVKVQTPNPYIAKWVIGNVQSPHSDKEFYPNYDIGSITYLNNNYSGGEIYFPQHNLELKPNAGTAVAFPGDEFYMHGVNEITEGVRYTLPVFWTIIQ
jgi:hypothetical protein